jgi:hexosaminidase
LGLTFLYSGDSFGKNGTFSIFFFSFKTFIRGDQMVLYRQWMFRFIVMFIVLILLSSGSNAIYAVSQEQTLDLVPVPKKISLGQGWLGIDSGFRVALTGFTEPRLDRAVHRLLERLMTQTGIPLPARLEEDVSKAVLEIKCAGPGEKIQSVREIEAYILEITSARALLEAPTPLGVLHGIETFLQLVQVGTEGFYVPAVRIQDEPRFPWRGLLIDVCRHWMPLDVVKRNLDGMAAVKLNVLHWHLSEDQGFRVECKSFPKLHEMGSDGNYFTQDQIREVVEYARDRGIRVIPEFDMPGHTTSWLVGYPELASAPGPYEIERHWGVFDPCMDPTKEELYEFLDVFIGEMAQLFSDEYFHIGGDEVNGKHWNANPDISSFKKRHGMKDNHDLQAYFNKRVQAIVKKHGKKMVGWDEIFHPELPNDVVVQSWRGPKALAEIAKKGYTGILSNRYYLDHQISAEQHYKVDPLSGDAAALIPDEQAFILGGEACMWAEFVNPETVDSRIWPRLAAVAERLWSPFRVNDADDMYRRLQNLDAKLDWTGMTHRTNYPKMLQRLAGEFPIEPLKVLADIVEPVKYYTRPNTKEYTQMTPLNRLVDAARPESLKAREFRQLVDEMLQSAPRYDTNRYVIEAMLKAWRDNHVQLLPVLESSFLLKEIMPLSQEVKELAEAGLRALQYLEQDQTPREKWLEQVKPLLERPKKPEYELEIKIVPAIRKMVETARLKREKRPPVANLPFLFLEDFEGGDARAWKPNLPQNWRVDSEEDSLAFHLTAPGEMGSIIAPTSWAVLKGFDVESFVLAGQVKCNADPVNPHRDMVIIFHVQDPTHFYYVHFSATSDDKHNIIGLVNGQDRVKINAEPAGKTVPRLLDSEYHDFRVSYDGKSGKILVFMDDMTTPLMTAVDRTFTHGLVGIGSFDDTGCFDNIKVWGKKIQ